MLCVPTSFHSCIFQLVCVGMCFCIVYSCAFLLSQYSVSGCCMASLGRSLKHRLFVMIYSIQKKMMSGRNFITPMNRDDRKIIHTVQHNTLKQYINKTKDKREHRDREIGMLGKG